ncbi:hypothetical protein JCM10212_005153 [Sporobolomyces blumeae]
MSDAYPGHFLDRPTAEDYAAFRHRRRRAEAEPLEGGDVLTWTGRSLEPDVLPPPDYPHDRSTSPNPPRPIHRALLDSDTGPSSRPWTLKLVEGLQTGVDQDSQVWRAKARPVDDPQTVVPVVVKLRHEALFPEPSNRTSLPICDNWNWFSAAYPQEREALAYRTARDLQGTDLPLCYGFFKFRLPNGEEFVAVVLEDLVDSGRALQLDQYLVREATVGRLDLDGFDKVACAAHRLQHRFHERDIGGFVLIQTEDFLYLRSASAQDDAALVGIGFGKTSSRSRAVYEEIERRQRLAAAEPLEGADELTWTGPSLEPDVAPPADYPHTRSTSPNPPRPIYRALLDAETGPTSKPWSLKFVEGLQTGVDKYSQVWRAMARPVDDAQTVVSVVVKLRHESSFPLPSSSKSHPPSDSWNWYSAGYLQEREALAYRTARDLQGTDLPICYGSFKFRLPSDERVVGVVLEDLVEPYRALRLNQHLVREATTERLSFEEFDGIACAAHRLQNRIHKLGIGGLILIRSDDFLYLRYTAPRMGAQLVGVGFGQSAPRQRIERACRLARDNSDAQGVSSDAIWHWYWAEVARDWIRVEEERRDLEFLDPVWRSSECPSSDEESESGLDSLEE